MSPLRRLLNLVIGLMLLQANLAAVAVPCTVGHGSEAGEHAAAGNRGAAAASMHTAMPGMTHDHHPDAPASTPAGSHDCDHSRGAESCGTMVSCIAVAAPERADALDARRPAVELAVVAYVDGPLSRTRLPEVPPPRV